MTDKTLLQECYDQLRIMFNPDVPLMQKLTARLAQPEPEPVAWMEDSIELYVSDHPTHSCTIPLYTAPPQREWQGLTDEEIEQIDGVEMRYIGSGDYTIEGEYEFARAIEAKLREKNS